MRQVSVAVYVPERAAVTDGLTTYGSDVYLASERDLALLTASERQYLLEMFVGRTADHELILDRGHYGWDDIVRALRASMNRSDATLRQEIEAREEARSAAVAQASAELLPWACSRFPEVPELARFRASGAPERIAPLVAHLVAADVKDALEAALRLRVGLYTEGTRHRDRIRLRLRSGPRPEAVRMLRLVQHAVDNLDLPPSCHVSCAVERLDIPPSEPGRHGIHVTVVSVHMTHPLWPERVFVVPTEQPVRQPEPGDFLQAPACP